MAVFKDYSELHNPHTVVGNLKISAGFYSPQLENRRDLLLWLPPSYETSEKHYPVIYMHDGHNLFDKYVSYSGEWQVDETMTQLAADGHEAIIVGLPNISGERFNEYSPFVDERLGGGKGDRYLDFVVHTVKAVIDSSFRTLPDRANTGIAGSSMGGLISLYAFFRHADVFSMAGVFSPAFWFANNRSEVFVRDQPFREGRIYLDIGTAEDEEEGDNPSLGVVKPYVRDARNMVQLLKDKGYSSEMLLYVEEQDAPHHESAWARRFPDAVRFLMMG